MPKEKMNEKFVKKIGKTITLRVFKVGCDKTNHRIIGMLPTTIKELMERLDLTKMPLNKRINDLEKVGLLKRKRYEGIVEPTELTHFLINQIDDVEEFVMHRLGDML